MRGVAVGLAATILSAAATMASASDEQVHAVRTFLREHLQVTPDMAERDKFRFRVAFRDLNGDGRPEALAYVLGQPWCGSGGCNFYILRHHRGGYRIVSRQATTQMPISVLHHRTNGWRDVSSYERFDATRGEELVMQYDGWKYPSFAPLRARRSLNDPTGEVVLTNRSRTYRF